MSDDKIIPFGKYKGQEITQVIARDPQYVQWIMQQAWFQEKFQPIYQVVINQFAPPSEDTPAHNALQVRFLELEYREAFERAANLFSEYTQQELFKAYKRRVRLALSIQPFFHRSYVRRHGGDGWMQSRFQEHRNDVRRLWAMRRRLPVFPPVRIHLYEPKFEDVSDVLFRVSITMGDADVAVSEAYTLAIEIKPSMGDDYPAVLRQIKRQQTAAKHADVHPSHWFLLVGEFASVAVTIDQVRQIFARDNINVLLVADVREQLIKLQRGSHG